jgi:hypothetical protein
MRTPPGGEPEDGGEERWRLIRGHHLAGCRVVGEGQVEQAIRRDRAALFAGPGL